MHHAGGGKVSRRGGYSRVSHCVARVVRVASYQVSSVRFTRALHDTHVHFMAAQVNSRRGRHSRDSQDANRANMVMIRNIYHRYNAAGSQAGHVTGVRHSLRNHTHGRLTTTLANLRRRRLL